MRARSEGVAVDTADLAQGARARVQGRADEKNVDIVIHCTCPKTWVEPTSFADALGELLDDAVRATRRGHPVVVDVHETHEGAVLWQIQDVGEGYPEQGSGVALARVVAERHGGILRVESAPGVGTTVSVWLPGH